MDDLAKHPEKLKAVLNYHIIMGSATAATIKNSDATLGSNLALAKSWRLRDRGKRCRGKAGPESLEWRHQPLTPCCCHPIQTAAGGGLQDKTTASPVKPAHSAIQLIALFRFDLFLTPEFSFLADARR